MNNEKMLKLMRFWLFGTFIIIFTAATLYTGVALGIGLQILREPNYWLAMGGTAILSMLAYYLYKGYLDRKA